jgi:pyrimidine-nucleoside phosphorylase
VLSAAGHLLALSDLGLDHNEGRRRAADALASGEALKIYERWIAAQGGDPALDALPQAGVVHLVRAQEAGFVQRIATTAVGETALRLGAGRVTKDDRIDHAVGIVMLAKRGDRLEAGQPLAEVHAADTSAAGRAATELLGCYTIGSEEPEPRPIVLDVLA